jgi:hypothetical protein
MTFRTWDQILPGYTSNVSIAYVYLKLHNCLDSSSEDDLAQEISNFKSECAVRFEVDTGVKIGKALGWQKSGCCNNQYEGSQQTACRKGASLMESKPDTHHFWWEVHWPDVRHEIARAIHSLTAGEDFSPSSAREFLELAQAKIRVEIQRQEKEKKHDHYTTRK